jgi:hypothetical protein
MPLADLVRYQNEYLSQVTQQIRDLYKIEAPWCRQVLENTIRIGHAGIAEREKVITDNNVYFSPSLLEALKLDCTPKTGEFFLKFS